MGGSTVHVNASVLNCLCKKIPGYATVILLAGGCHLTCKTVLTSLYNSLTTCSSCIMFLYSFLSGE